MLLRSSGYNRISSRGLAWFASWTWDWLRTGAEPCHGFNHVMVAVIYSGSCQKVVASSSGHVSATVLPSSSVSGLDVQISMNVSPTSPQDVFSSPNLNLIITFHCCVYFGPLNL